MHLCLDEGKSLFYFISHKIDRDNKMVCDSQCIRRSAYEY